MAGYRYFINAFVLILSTVCAGGAMGKESIRSRNTVESRDLTTSTREVTALELFNANTDAKLQDLGNNDIVVVSSIPGMTKPAFNIRATTTGSDIAYVIFGYNTTTSYNKETSAPYAFCGNQDNNYFVCDKLGLGTHIVTATPYTSSNVAGKSLSVKFRIVATPLVGMITAMTLVRADTDTAVKALTNSTTVYVKSLVPSMASPTFNINASYTGPVRSVAYWYNGARYRTEEVAPYAFCGNSKADFFSCVQLGCGNHIVSVVPYSRNGAQGVAGSRYAVSFAIDCTNTGRRT